jgi:hypothetical protein
VERGGQQNDVSRGKGKSARTEGETAETRERAAEVNVMGERATEEDDGI